MGSSQVSKDNDAHLKADPERVFRCLVQLLDLGKEIISFLLQLRLLLHLLGSGFASAGPVSIMLCFVPLILENLWDHNLWSKGLYSCLFYSTCPDVRSLRETGGEWRLLTERSLDFAYGSHIQSRGDGRQSIRLSFKRLSVLSFIN
jgi:hypothetical protein